MSRFRLFIFAILVISSASRVWAAEEVKEKGKDYSTACAIGERPIYRLAGTMACVAGGMGIGLGLHEGLHAAVGGSDLHWRGTNWSCPECSRGRAQTIALAPFVGQAFTTEVLLGFKNIPREHPVIAGILIWNVLNPVVYTIRSEVSGGYGDLGNFHRPRDRRIIEGLLVSHALLSAYRLLTDERPHRFPLLIQSNGKDVLAVFEFKW